MPHELRARDLMLEKQRKSQQRLLPQHVGPGPESTRAGRFIPARSMPRSEQEKMELARRALAKKRAMEAHQLGKEAVRDSIARPKVLNATNNENLSYQDYKGIAPARKVAMDAEASRREARKDVVESPRISRIIMGDKEHQLQQFSAQNNSRDNQAWGQLRKRGQTMAVEQRRAHESGFEEGRALREAQAKSGRYTPLGKRSAFGSGMIRNAQEPVRPSQPNDDRRPVRRPLINPTEAFSRRQAKPQQQSSAQEDVSDPQTIKFSEAISDRSVPSEQMQFRARSISSRNWPVQKDEKSQEKMVDEAISRPAREERRKKPRSQYTTEPEAYDVPKGKGKDKARRRQQFARAEEDQDEQEEALLRAEAKRQRKREKAAKKATAPTPILLPEYISVSNLAVALKVRFEEFAEKMEELGFNETGHDHILNAENAGLIAMEYDYEAIIDRADSEDLKAREPFADPSTLPQRPPVVTIMGHVDHGKTTLLDWLRKSSVAATEHGGITQHIGAFSVSMPGGKIITFLDTPGHAAFLSMRQRGANVTDIIILVVAADDSVKPQTIEAINHAKAAKVPIIVAVNKIDKEEANVDRVKQDLARHGIDVEDFGGDTQVVCVSGKTGQGMDELEEATVTLSEILDMRAETDGQAEGWVLEASIKSMGKVATVLVRRGTMRTGDFIVAGKTWARIRCLRNEAGAEILEAGPGTPVEIDGWREQPLAGDEVLQAPDEAKAKSVIKYRLERDERDKMAQDMEAINENRKGEQEKRERTKAEAAALAEAKGNEEVTIETAPKDGKPTGLKDVYFVIKGDVSGSVEAVIDSITTLGNKEVQPHILRSGVGQLSEFDVEHAAAAKGHVINFNTTIEPRVAKMAAESKVSILDHNIIYRLVDDVKAELSKHLPPLITQRVLGEAEIAQVFEITVKGRQHKAIAGCKVRNGTISKNAKVRVLRGGGKMFDGMHSPLDFKSYLLISIGTLASLKSVKKDVQEMKKGSECGMGFEEWFDFRVGDQVQCYEEKEEKRYL